jgi:hypothetical protein
MLATLPVPAIADPIYYIGVTPYMMLGAARYLEGLRFITANDCFGGRWDRIVFSAGTPVASLDIRSEVNRLLGAAALENRFRREEAAHALFLMFDERAQSAASGLGLNVCLPTAEIRANLDDKLAGTRLADAAGVPTVPNVLEPIGGYEDLRRRCSHLGADLVVQLPFGDSGDSTFFISCEADFQRYAGAIAKERFVKVMKRIRCRQMTIEACNTRCGTFVGPLMKELIGFSELTLHRGGWCGNELVPPGDSALPPSLRRQAQRAAIAIGAALAREGYRGCFGVDFLLDEDSGKLYFGELNPRFTGATPLSTQAAFEENLPPLLVLHLLEWLGRPIPCHAEAYNRQMLESTNTQAMGSLVIKHLGADSQILDGAPASGIWRMAGDGRLRFTREAFDPADITRADEVFLLRTAEPGQIVPTGSCLARAFLRGSLLDSSYRLNARATALVEAIRNLFQVYPARKAATPLA